MLCLILILSACGSNLRPTQRSTPAVTIMPDTSAVIATPQATSTPELTPLTGCPATLPIRLILQERGQVIDDNESLNMRSGPGTSYPVLVRIESAELFLVVGGPTCADGYTWFQVRYSGQIGWIAEGDLSEYYVEPYLPG
jgi:uncharacterized protein YgiM (DUF1202 family)